MIDRQVILAVIWVLGGNAIVLIGGIVYSSITGTPVDNGISTLAGTVIGYLGGILTNVTKVQQQASAPARAEIVNSPDNPIPTTEAPAPKNGKKRP